MAKLSVAKTKTLVAKTDTPLRLDLGCGKHPREGFSGVDSRDFGQPYIWNLAILPWCLRSSGDKSGMVIPIEDSSVEEAHSSHFIEHLTATERIIFVNELYRVLKPGGKCQLITPHWASCRAYGDLTHQWPPVSEFWFYYLDKNWRASNAPHNDGYTCDFEATWGYSTHQSIQTRNQEYQMHALTFWKEAAQDTIATLTARK